MKIYCLGDSLTEGDYGVRGQKGVANIHAENYPYFLQKLTRAEVVNAGRCGYKASDYLQYYEQGYVQVRDADMIIILLGTNGGLDPEMDTPSNMAYRKLVNLCKQDAPQAKIYLCTPPHATENPELSNCGHAPRVKRAVAFVRKLAEESKVDLIDLACCEAFSAENEHVMQPNDGLHFGRVGYQTMAEYIYNTMNTDKVCGT